jgi:hypothetical protein
MVTSQKIYEKIMGNRGSKSAILNEIVVKEQRVDGSWCGSGKTFLERNTLSGLFVNYRVIPTKVNYLTNKILYGKSYTTAQFLTTNVLNP